MQYTKLGKRHNCRALLDSGSEQSFATQRLCVAYRFLYNDFLHTISGFGNKNVVLDV